MRVYAETSAVMSWILGESAGDEVLERLSLAEEVLTSDLTLVECDRALVRAVAMERFTEAEAAGRQLVLTRAMRKWGMLRLHPQAFERAGRPFPHEPVRTLDALHLAMALRARAYLPDLEVLALDRRVRENATAMGFLVTPDL
jgi:predicted nucleic acid-binding protein